MTALQRKIARLDALEEEILAEVRAAYPNGRTVKWTHGMQVRMGVIIDFSGWQLHCASFKVRSVVSGREYWVCALQIVEANEAANEAGLVRKA